MYINFPGLFMAKATLVEEQIVVLFNPELRYKGVDTFSKGISPKENVIERLEFEPTYYVYRSPARQPLCHEM